MKRLNFLILFFFAIQSNAAVKNISALVDPSAQNFGTLVPKKDADVYFRAVHEVMNNKEFDCVDQDGDEASAASSSNLSAEDYQVYVRTDINPLLVFVYYYDYNDAKNMIQYKFFTNDDMTEIVSYVATNYSGEDKRVGTFQKPRYVTEFKQALSMTCKVKR